MPLGWRKNYFKIWVKSWFLPRGPRKAAFYHYFAVSSSFSDCWRKTTKITIEEEPHPCSIITRDYFLRCILISQNNSLERLNTEYALLTKSWVTIRFFWKIITFEHKWWSGNHLKQHVNNSGFFFWIRGTFEAEYVFAGIKDVSFCRQCFMKITRASI